MRRLLRPIAPPDNRPGHPMAGLTDIERAERAGWSWSAAHNGWINEAVHNTNDDTWGAYTVAADTQAALEISGEDG